MEYRLLSMSNHMVWRAASVVSPFYSILLALGLGKAYYWIIINLKLWLKFDFSKSTKKIDKCAIIKCKNHRSLQA